MTPLTMTASLTYHIAGLAKFIQPGGMVLLSPSSTPASTAPMSSSGAERAAGNGPRLPIPCRSAHTSKVFRNVRSPSLMTPRQFAG